MRISDWSSDVCSSDLCSFSSEPSPCCSRRSHSGQRKRQATARRAHRRGSTRPWSHRCWTLGRAAAGLSSCCLRFSTSSATPRSEEHTSELQSLMRISYAVFCLKKKKTHLTKPYIMHLEY